MAEFNWNRRPIWAGTGGRFQPDWAAEFAGMRTHSEYIIYRLQKLIRLGELKPEDVSVVYVTKDQQGSHCLQLRLDQDGDFLDPWPGGFFETGFEEMFGVP